MIVTRPIGIDLGTTNSAVAMLDPNERDLILWSDELRRPIVPSCVWQHPKTKEIVVGFQAYARRGTRPEPIASVKRSMGTKITIDFAGAPHQPSEISAYILRDLKAKMAAELQRRAASGTVYDVSRAIVTVPAYFGLPAIEATREAGVKAGLEVAELLHEPTAAAIYYTWKHDLPDGIYMVYDLGGGTFDVSILQRTAGEFLVLGISGDNFLGGDDFDRRLANYLRELLVADGYDLELDVEGNAEDRLRFSSLVAIAERAKKQLSKAEEVVVHDQGSLDDKSGNRVIVEIAITRRTFEGLIDDLLDRTVACCHDALQKAHAKSGITIKAVDHILLVGGSTYVPAVVEKVRRAFCGDAASEEPRASCAAPIRDEPDTAVALGAALRAATAGIGIGDDARRVRLWFTGAGATRRSTANLAGRIEQLDETLSLHRGRLCVSAAAGEPLGEAVLEPDLHFNFARIDLAAESVNEFQFQLFDSGGQLVASVGRTIAHSAQHKQAVGRTLSTAVLSKPIVLEGTDGDRLVRETLLAEGTALPAHAHFTFAVSDPTGVIRLPIYQESRIIKELRAAAGPVTVGTPVQVSIGCDEQVRITVDFAIADQRFGGQIEAPPPDTVPTEFEIEQIDARFFETIGRLDPADRERLRALYERTRHDLQEARAGADYPKVIQRRAELEGHVRDARLAEPLNPPLHAVEASYQRCVELGPAATKGKSQLSGLLGDLATVMVKARDAYANRDRQNYDDAARAINAALQFLVASSESGVESTQNVDVTLEALMTVQQAREIAQFVLIHCLIHRHPASIPVLNDHLHEINELEQRASADPVGVRNRSQVIITETRRIFQKVAPEQQRAADLEGLLTVGPRATTATTRGKGMIK